MPDRERRTRRTITVQDVEVVKEYLLAQEKIDFAAGGIIWAKEQDFLSNRLGEETDECLSAWEAADLAFGARLPKARRVQIAAHLCRCEKCFALAETYKEIVAQNRE